MNNKDKSMMVLAIVSLALVIFALTNAETIVDEFNISFRKMIDPSYRPNPLEKWKKEYAKAMLEVSKPGTDGNGAPDDYLKSAEKFKRVVELAEKIDGRNRYVVLAISLNSLGNCFFYGHKYADAEIAYRRAVEAAAKTEPSEFTDLPYGAELEIIFDLENTLDKQNKPTDPALIERVRSLSSRYNARRGPWVQWISW